VLGRRGLHPRTVRIAGEIPRVHCGACRCPYGRRNWVGSSCSAAGRRVPLSTSCSLSQAVGAGNVAHRSVGASGHSGQIPPNVLIWSAAASRLVDPVPAQNRQGSLVVRANYNVPACHATQPREAQAEPVASYSDRGPLNVTCRLQGRRPYPRASWPVRQLSPVARIFAGHWTRAVIAAVAPILDSAVLFVLSVC
jgi:hypothetical protein